MINEIGSEFCTPIVSDRYTPLLPQNAILFKCGRAALDNILFDIEKSGYNPKSVLMPAYCCGSMLLPFIKKGIDVDFYPVSINESGGINAIIEKDADIILLMDYFGFCGSSAMIPKSFSGIIIRDVTHSVLSKSDRSDAQYIFGSLRKWDAFATGGFAYKTEGEMTVSPENEIPDKEYISIRETAQSQKDDYLSGKSENKEYLKIFSKAEDLLDEYFTGAFSNADRQLLDVIDWNEIKEKRRNNAKLITAGLNGICLFKEVKEGDVPLCIPIILPEERRNALRVHLIKNSIYCPIHWPRPNCEGVMGCDIYDMELSLICDQRYDADDILREINCVKEFLKNY